MALLCLQDLRRGDALKCRLLISFALLLIATVGYLSSKTLTPIAPATWFAPTLFLTLMRDARLKYSLEFTALFALFVDFLWTR